MNKLRANMDKRQIKLCVTLRLWRRGGEPTAK
jgi:hypothetical protein